MTRNSGPLHAWRLGSVHGTSSGRVVHTENSAKRPGNLDRTGRKRRIGFETKCSCADANGLPRAKFEFVRQMVLRHRALVAYERNSD